MNVSVMPAANDRARDMRHLRKSMQIEISLNHISVLDTRVSAAAGSESGCLTVVLQQRQELELLQLGQQAQLLHTRQQFGRRQVIRPLPKLALFAVVCDADQLQGRATFRSIAHSPREDVTCERQTLRF